MKRLFVILLAGLLLIGCRVQSRTESQASAVPEPTEAPTPTAEPTVTPEPVPTPQPLSEERLCGTWELEEVIESDGTYIGIRENRIESHLIFNEDHTYIYDWNERYGATRTQRNWKIAGNNIIPLPGTNDPFFYEPETDRILFRSDARTYRYRRTDAFTLPPFRVPEDASGKTDGVIGVWHLVRIESEQPDSKIDGLNASLAAGRYAMRVQFKEIGTVAWYWEEDRDQFLDAGYNFVLDRDAQMIRIFREESDECPYSLEGNVLKIQIGGAFYVFVRNPESFSA